MMHALQLVLRLVHIVFGVFWVGAAFFLAMFLEPSIRAAGPARLSTRSSSRPDRMVGR